MGKDAQGKADSFPEDLRSKAAEIYDTLWPAIRDERWRDAASAAREILHLLREYPDAALPTPVKIERAWSYFAFGMAAKNAGHLREAVSLLTKASDVLPHRWHPSATARALWVLGSANEELHEWDSAIEAQQRLVDLCHNEPQRLGPVWFAIGCNRERRGERLAAITAYSEALDQYPGYRQPGGKGDWRHRARAGIVRCQIADGSQPKAFWDHWWRLGCVPRLVFLAFALTAGVLFAVSIAAVSHGDYTAAGWWLGLFGAAVSIILLPAVRRMSGRGFTIELQKQGGRGFTIELGDAPKRDDLPLA